MSSSGHEDLADEGVEAEEDNDDVDEEDDDDSDDENFDPNRRFERLCQLLRENDEDTDMVHIPSGRGLDEGYGERLGSALENNTHVQELRLNISSLLSPTATNTNGTLPLLRFIRTSSSLTGVGLVRGPNHDLLLEVADLVLDAIAESSSITSLDAQVTLSPFRLAHLLRRTTSIKDMIVYTNGHPDSNNAVAQRRLAEAFAANTSLHVLCVGSAFEEMNDMAALMLQQLADTSANSNSQLRQLILCFGTDVNLQQFQALAQFLRATTTLEYLTLSQYAFDEEAVHLVFGALQSNPVVTTLNLAGCTFDEEAQRALVRFMQNLHSFSRSATYGTEPVVLNLLVRTPFDDTAMFDDMNGVTNIGESLATLMLCSSVQTLDLGDCLGRDLDDFAFFDALTLRPQVYLQTLNLSTLSVEGALHLARFLRSTSTLQTLVISEMDRRSDRRRVLSGLHDNGSLTSVELHCGNERPLFRGRQLAYVQAILQRNQALRLVLAELRLPDRFPAGRRGPVDEDDDTNTCSRTITDLELLPVLFGSARQAPRMAGTSHLIGLSAAVNDVIGPAALPLLADDEEVNEEVDTEPLAKRPRLV